MVNDSFDLTAVDFQGKDPDEKFQFYFRQHWVRLLWPFTRMLLLTAILLFVGYILFFVIGFRSTGSRHSMIVIFGLLFFCIQWAFLLRIYTYFLYVVIVTDRKVHRIKKTLFSFDDHQSVDLWSFQDIHKTQHGLIQNILGYGSITMESQDTILRIHFVPRIVTIYNTMMHLRERARGQRVIS